MSGIHDFGYVRVAAVCPKVRPADVNFNVDSIIDCLKILDDNHVDVAVFPELCVTGYTCADLFLSETLLQEAFNGLERLREVSKTLSTAFVVGAPTEENGVLLNMAFLIAGGEIRIKTGKRYIPNYREFYEKRWFKSWEGWPQFYQINDKKGRVKARIGIEICEDLWVPEPPSTKLALAGADIILNLSASDDVIGKYDYLLNLIKHQSAACVCAYVYAGAGFGESSTDLVFDGKAVIAENGKLLAKNNRWSNDASIVIADIDVEALRQDRKLTGYFNSQSNCEALTGTVKGLLRNKETGDLRRNISPTPFVPHSSSEREERCNEIVNIQTAGLARRLDATGCKNLVVGISGGLDSTLALLVACRTFDRLGLDRKGILAVTMPGFGTTDRTRGNAEKLCELLGVSFRTVDITPAVRQHFIDINHDEKVHDVTYENSQARMRTLILMNLANKQGGMVLGTGDLSELALGWATYNGDHMSMYNVNVGVPKTLVRYLIEWFATDSDNEKISKVLNDIIATPISPELLPPNPDNSIAQITEDVVGPYELHDFFLYYTLRYGFTPEKIFFMARRAFEGKFDRPTILKWMRTFYRRFFAQQFKRSCMPDGPKVGSVSLSPRGDWRMPSDASAAAWIERVDKMIADEK